MFPFLDVCVLNLIPKNINCYCGWAWRKPLNWLHLITARQIAIHTAFIISTQERETLELLSHICILYILKKKKKSKYRHNISSVLKETFLSKGLMAGRYRIKTAPHWFTLSRHLYICLNYTHYYIYTALRVCCACLTFIWQAIKRHCKSTKRQTK